MTTQCVTLAELVVEEVCKKGIKECYICPGARSASLIQAFKQKKSIKIQYGFEERSMAFYALGRARQTKSPVAIVTTSGTAVGELLPAAMEAHYTGTPLLFISADRPRRFRTTGAPQSAEQVGIFGLYANHCWDVADDEPVDLSAWNVSHERAHLNVCLEDPMSSCKSARDSTSTQHHNLDSFLESVSHPFVIVSRIPESAKEAVRVFIETLGAPVYCEATSGLTGLPNQIRCIENLWQRGTIDGVLRIGGVPTLRPWRDLEEMQGQVQVLSMSERTFSGLSWGNHLQMDLNTLGIPKKTFSIGNWVENDRSLRKQIIQLFHEEPNSEPAIFYRLSLEIPENSHLYLGNSMPIREWDLAASHEKTFEVTASRGVNGIDGQISQFLGLSSPTKSNWAILGDLTTLYDMAGPWVLRDLPDIEVTIVVINNGGGQIFSRMFPDPEFINGHSLAFKPLADLWGFDYETWPTQTSQRRLVEIVPDAAATEKFWKRYQTLVRLS